MTLKGKGYSVGPGYQIEGAMVFDIIDHHDSFVMLVREDKEYAIDEKTRRRENAVYVSEEMLRSLISAEWLRKRLGLT